MIDKSYSTTRVELIAAALMKALNQHRGVFESHELRAVRFDVKLNSRTGGVRVVIVTPEIEEEV